eukprot:jgi/Ulvmu1/8024/UM004_0261.1
MITGSMSTCFTQEPVPTQLSQHASRERGDTGWRESVTSKADFIVVACIWPAVKHHHWSAAYISCCVWPTSAISEEELRARVIAHCASAETCHDENGCYGSTHD